MDAVNQVSSRIASHQLLIFWGLLTLSVVIDAHIHPPPSAPGYMRLVPIISLRF